MLSAKRWIKWIKPLRIHCKRTVLVAMLGLFASVHLLTATSQDSHFADTSLTSANWNSAGDANLNATVESGESTVSMDVHLRDANNSLGQPGQSRRSSADKMSGLRRFTETGTTGPPSQLNNNSAAI